MWHYSFVLRALMRVCLAVVFIAVLVDCGKGSRLPRSEPGRAKTSQSHTQPETSDIDSEEQVQSRRELNSLIRKYRRKRAAYERSEADYFERLHLWVWNFVMLELRHTPGTFAGDMPGHEEYVYNDFIDATENLSSYVGVYRRYLGKSDSEWATLDELDGDLQRDLQIEFPGSGSRLDDAIVAIQTENYKKIADTDKEKVWKMIQSSGIQTGNEAWEIFKNGYDNAPEFLKKLIK